MEVITKEIIINSFLKAGYDKVDTFTYSYLLDKLSNLTDSKFIFVSEDFTSVFSDVVECNNGVYSVKKECSNKTNELSISNDLVTFILNIDTIDLVKHKLYFYGFLSYSDYDDCFSTIEKEYRQIVFGSQYKNIISDIDKSNVTIRTKKEINE